MAALLVFCGPVGPVGYSESSGSSGSSAPPAPGPVLLELFTSEGCSSCPPADALLVEVAGAAPVDVVALELHVDYWDDLGWKDPFSQHAFSVRQAAYGEALGKSGVYTPQLVVNGAAEGVGSDRGRLAALRAAARAPSLPVTLLARLDGDAGEIVVDTHADAPLVVVVAESGLVTNVKHGENAGRRLAHGAVVRRLVPVPPSGQLRIPVAPDWQRGKLSVVAIAQRGAGPVLGFARAQL